LALANNTQAFPIIAEPPVRVVLLPKSTGTYVELSNSNSGQLYHISICGYWRRKSLLLRRVLKSNQHGAFEADPE